MFLKRKTPNPKPLGVRITRPCFSELKDVVKVMPDGTSVIVQELSEPCPEPFRDLGDADCYGIAYQQSHGVDLHQVENRNRVTPMEAIRTAEEAIDNLYIPDNYE